jgi:predicted N-acetyltransferase YhbS
MANESTFSLQVVSEPEVSEELDLAIRQLLCRCFPADADAFSRNRAWHDSAPSYSVVYCENDDVLGHIGIVVRVVRCGDVQVTVAGVQNMCVAPERRHTGLSQQLMTAALSEARLRGLSFGLLFCVPELETFYQRQGWSRTNEPATMLDETGQAAPIPGKNIAMFIELASQPFPPGPIDLQGRDW